MGVPVAKIHHARAENLQELVVLSMGSKLRKTQGQRALRHNLGDELWRRAI